MFTIEIWNPCSPSFRFRTPVHDQLELLSRWLGIPSVFGWLSIHSFSMRSSRERRLALVIRRFRSKTARYADGPLRRYENLNIQTGDQIFPNRSPWTPAVTTGSPLQIRPGGQSHIGMPVYAGPIQSKRTLLNVPGLRPRVRKKAKISGFSVCDFLYFSYLYMESQAPNKKLTTRRGCGYGLHSAQDI